MTAEGLAPFISRLLNRPVKTDEMLSLSSSQRARVRAWCTEHHIQYPNLRQPVSLSQFAELTEAPPIAEAAPSTDAPAPPARAGSLALGVDIQSISELFPEHVSDFKADPQLTAIFTLRELSYAEAKPDPYQTLTGLFAAKEAIMKTSPTLMRMALNAIEVLPDERGAPVYGNHTLSISHSGGMAVAVAAYPAPAQEASVPVATAVPAGADAPDDPTVAPPLAPRRGRSPVRMLAFYAYHLFLAAGAAYALFLLARSLHLI